MTPDPTPQPDFAPEYGPVAPRCLCDGGAYEVKDHPFIVNSDCPTHGSALTQITDHGAAGFCTDHGQADSAIPTRSGWNATGANPTLIPDERVETVARVIYAELNYALTPETSDAIDVVAALADKVAAAVVAALDDESARLRDAADASDCDRCDDSLAGKPDGWVAGWVAAMRFAHHAHAPESGERFMSANGVLGAGPDAVIVDGDWLDANLADPDALARAKAEAWDEGWVAGCNDQQYGNDDAEPWTPNPYRAEGPR